MEAQPLSAGCGVAGSRLLVEIRMPGLPKWQGIREAQRRCQVWVPALQVPRSLSLRETTVGLLLGHLASPQRALTCSGPSLGQGLREWLAVAPQAEGL